MAYWKLIHDEGPVEWDGKHNVFIDVVDANGKRIVGVPVLFYWNDGNDRRETEPKPGEPYAIDFPMFAAGAAYSVKIDDGTPGDIKQGMGLIPFQKHVSYKLVFMLVDDNPTPAPPPTSHDSYLVLDGVVVWRN